MKIQILTMLKMQDAMNSKVNPAWETAGFPWYRAIWTECAEMLDHYGWKWWKHQKPDMEQVKLEIVDIWHFTLSAYLLKGLAADETAEMIERELQQPLAARDLRSAIEELAKEVIESKTATIPPLACIMQFCDMGFDELYRTYVGKNVLNFFRQDHGYKEGHYQKTWRGKEDNECLSTIMASLNPQSATFSDEVYQALAAAYPGQQIR